MPVPTVDQMAQPAPLNERAFRLFSYLRELTALNLARVTDLMAYDNVVWLTDLPQNDSCVSILRGQIADAEVSDWIEIKKRPEPKIPQQPPQACNGWYSPGQVKNSATEPKLYERVQAQPAATGSTEHGEYIELRDCPSVGRAWATYLEAYWKPWAETHKLWKKHHDFYSSFFTIEQQAKRLGEAYELLVGIGLLTWITPGGEKIRRHLVTARALLSFDAQSGTITLRAAAEGPRIALEYDMLDPDSRPGPTEIKACEQLVSSCGDDLWATRQKAALRSWVNAMSDRGTYADSLTQPDSFTSFPAVSFAPALILRKRTRRSLVTLLQNIAGRLKEMEPTQIPFGVRRLCEIVGESQAPLDSEIHPTSGGATTLKGEAEIFFPLPSNEEQREIVERLRGNRGVLVQGPPGTGKSLTIANLICHLLAEGKRILVTSQTERALKVLQGKLPAELQALCVTVLGADETALRNMEKSVLGINDRQTNWEPKKNAESIARLELELRNTRQSKATAEARLLQLRAIEFQTFSVAGGKYQGTAAAISRELESQKAQLGWISDEVPDTCEQPVSEDEARMLHATLIALPPNRRRECSQATTIPTSIPTISHFMEFLRRERDALEHLGDFGALDGSNSRRVLLTWTTADRQTLRALIERLRNEMARIRQTAPQWTEIAANESLVGRSKAWMDLLNAMERDASKMEGKVQSACDRELHLPSKDRQVIRGDAQCLLDHLKSGKGLGWGIFRAKVVRDSFYLIREARVNGRLCDNPSVLEELVEHLHVERTVDVLWAHCAPHSPRLEGTLRAQISELEQFIENLRLVHNLLEIQGEIRRHLKSRARIPEPPWQDDAALETLLREIDAAEADHLLNEARAAFGAATHQLEIVAVTPNAHSSVRAMLAAIRDRSADSFAKEMEATEALLQDREKWDRAAKVSARLRKIAPILAGALETDPNAPHWSKRLEDFDDAWSFAQASSWLATFIGGIDAASAETEVRRCEKKIADSLESLAAHHSWRHCLNRLTEGQRQHMIAWKDAIKRIGKGTGVRAPIHRQNAREHMEECRAAIPAWIMPFYRVAETVGDSPEPYDVVIVDESSQSGPEACMLMYLAKRCIIVGDDKQISPEAVGIERAQVDQLSEQYLFDNDHRDSFGAESSLFSQAQIRFGGRIRLREHFRCMPEIIRFSNDLCYQDEPLLPLRQYAANRLEPIVVRHVPMGMRSGGSSKITNDVEAAALVDALVQCIMNPAYAGKTMGVISLLGEAQAQRIREMVVTRVEPRVIEERELTFGDAYAFQGDERDIIFLSMVAAPNAANAALTNSKAEQRFNVAASRARDQIWLFHSIMPADLNTADVRYRLLSYYLNPEAPSAFDPDWSKCDSKFEETVGKIVHERGYRIIPQFEPFGKGGKRLDFVVEGVQARLAIECDGDEYHSSPEDIHNDLVRQRQLERCGWTFWRLRQSEFHWDRIKSLEPLWRRLDDLKIKPRKPRDEPVDEAMNSPTAKPATIDPVNVVQPKTQIAVLSLATASSNPACSRGASVRDAVAARQTEVSFRRKPELEPLEGFLLEMLTVPKRLETDALTIDAIRSLGLGSDGRRKIDSALRNLESKGLVRLGVNYVATRVDRR